MPWALRPVTGEESSGLPEAPKWRALLERPGLAPGITPSAPEPRYPHSDTPPDWVTLYQDFAWTWVQTLIGASHHPEPRRPRPVPRQGVCARESGPDRLTHTSQPHTRKLAARPREAGVPGSWSSAGRGLSPQAPRARPSCWAGHFSEVGPVLCSWQVIPGIGLLGAHS